MSLRIFQFVVIHIIKGFSIVNEAEVLRQLSSCCVLRWWRDKWDLYGLFDKGTNSITGSISSWLNHFQGLPLLISSHWRSWFQHMNLRENSETLVYGRLDDGHSHKGGQYASLNLPMQMLISPRKILTDTPRIMFGPMSGHLMAWSKLRYKISHHII